MIVVGGIKFCVQAAAGSSTSFFPPPLVSCVCVFEAAKNGAVLNRTYVGPILYHI